MTTPTAKRSDLGWRTYTIIILFGCLIAMIGFGPRSSLGLFLPPMTAANGWSRDIYAFAIALQMLLWGAAQPFAGAIADRFGAVLVICGGALLYAGGLAMMAYSTSAGALFLSAGVLIGIGLSGVGFTIIIGAFGKLLPAEWRTFSFGIGTAASSFGQFLFSPLAAGLNSMLHWQTTLLIFAAIVLLTMPLSLALARPRETADTANTGTQSVRQALSEATRHKSYILLITGYFTCGFQLFFITVHLPAYLVDRGISVEIGAWTLAVIGLFNIVGSLTSGFLASRFPKRYMLTAIYALRSLAILIFINVPASPVVTMIFGAVIGLLWLSSVPPTQGIIAVMFGTRWLTMLAGLAFFSHQVGGFLGVWLGGVLYEASGSYTAIWYVAIALGIVSALINIPIVEKPVARPVAASV
ncbi:MAG TPA: MFS transporter [Xanthobacteraceae bacterium]|nr:MFS transporter [Xanthobacteraceae bacterium]